MTKKLLAVLTAIMMLGSMLCVPAFADSYVPSPTPGEEPEPTPSSPQTGYELGIGCVAAAIAVSGGVAYVCTKKANSRT